MLDKLLPYNDRQLEILEQRVKLDMDGDDDDIDKVVTLKEFVRKFEGNDFFTKYSYKNIAQDSSDEDIGEMNEEDIEKMVDADEFLPPINFLDIYSLKALGDLRKFFFYHWNCRVIRNDNVFSFFFISNILQLVILMQRMDKNTYNRYQKHAYKNVTDSVKWQLVLILSMIFYYGAKLNGIYDIALVRYKTL